jgi:hypothetical protein
MEGVRHSRAPLFWNHDTFFQALGAQVVLIHLRQVLEKNQIIIRFDNGYGVIIFPISLERDNEVFEMLVLKFYGARINDYKLTQYAHIPELNWGNLDEIIDLCKEVSLLPRSETIKLSSDQSKAKVRKKELDERCSIF